jgi:hypothetical protein
MVTMTTPAFWVHITDGAIDRAPGLLPASWGNVSGLDGLSLEELAKLGWHPVFVDRPPHDPETQRLGAIAATVTGQGADIKVTATWPVLDRSVLDIRSDLIQRARDEARERILDALVDADPDYQAELARIDKAHPLAEAR